MKRIVLETATYLSDSLREEFMEDLKKHSPYFAKWVRGRYAGSLRFPGDIYSPEAQNVSQEVEEELNRLGWKPRGPFKAGDRMYTFKGTGQWPILYDGLDKGILIHSDETDNYIPGSDAVQRALKAAGLSVEINRGGRWDENNDLLLIISKKGKPTLRGASVAKIVQQALDADMRVNRPAYIDNPWTKTGRTQLIPGQRNSYELHSGDWRWSVNTYTDYISVAASNWSRRTTK